MQAPAISSLVVICNPPFPISSCPHGGSSRISSSGLTALKPCSAASASDSKWRWSFTFHGQCSGHPGKQLLWCGFEQASHLLFCGLRPGGAKRARKEDDASVPRRRGGGVEIYLPTFLVRHRFDGTATSSSAYPTETSGVSAEPSMAYQNEVSKMEEPGFAAVDRCSKTGSRANSFSSSGWESSLLQNEQFVMSQVSEVGQATCNLTPNYVLTDRQASCAEARDLSFHIQNRDDPVTQNGDGGLDLHCQESSYEQGGGTVVEEKARETSIMVSAARSPVAKGNMAAMSRRSKAVPFGQTRDNYLTKSIVNALIEIWKKNDETELSESERFLPECVQSRQKTLVEGSDDINEPNFLVKAFHTAMAENPEDDSTSSRLTVFTELQLALDEYFLRHQGANNTICSSILVALSKKGNSSLGWKVLNWAESSGIQVSVTAYNALLLSCVKNKFFKEALDLFELIKRRTEPTDYTYALSLNAAVQFHGWDFALHMFNAMEKEDHRKPTLAIYNTLLSACGRARQWDTVQALWEKMRLEGCQESFRTFQLLLGSFVQAARCDLALEVYYSMIKMGIKPSESATKGMVCVCAKAGRWALALEFFIEMVESKMKPSHVVCNALIDSLGKAGELRLAWQVYEVMTEAGIKNSVYTLSALLNGLNKARLYRKSVELFEAVTSYLSPNIYVYHSVLIACKGLGAWEKSLQLVWEMERRGPKPDTTCYTLVICACKDSKQVDVAFEIYERMQQMKCIPNSYTYHALIQICGKMYMWGEAQQLFEEMVSRGIAPNIYVYNSLIQALKKSGHDDRAQKYQEKMLRECY